MPQRVPVAYEPGGDWTAKLRWVPVRNDASEVIPPYALLRVTGMVLDEGFPVFTVAKPHADDLTNVLVGGPVPIPAGERGAAHATFPGEARYEPADGTPAAGSEWGTASGSWGLRSGKAGFVIVGVSAPGVAVVRVAPPAAGGGGSLTVKEVDGSPSYTSITEVRVDQVDGLSLTQPAAGVVRIDILEASTTQTGVVTTASQQFVGVKDFTTNVLVGGLLHVYDLTGADQYGEYNTVEWNQTDADHTDTGSGGTFYTLNPGGWRAVLTEASSVYRWNLGQTNTDGHAPGVGGVGSSGRGLYVESSEGVDGVRLVLCGDDGSSGPARYAVYDVGAGTVSTGVTGTGGGGDTFVGGICTGLASGGATGTFTTTDGKTVTVANGVVTSIV